MVMGGDEVQYNCKYFLLNFIHFPFPPQTLAIIMQAEDLLLEGGRLLDATPIELLKNLRPCLLTPLYVQEPRYVMRAVKHTVHFSLYLDNFGMHGRVASLKLW